MPELPEVETIKNGLQKKIVGLTFKNIQILNSKSFQGDESKVKGKKVVNLWRRAKMLGVDLTDDLTLLFHLKMTGQLIYIAKSGEEVMGGHPTENMLGKMPNKDTRVIFNFTDGSALYFNDQIKFGWIKLLQTSKIREQKEIQNLGPEPLEKSFTWQILKESLMKRSRMPIKVAIMDQSLISGVGNIYASEALFLARIDPRRAIKTLSNDEFKKLHKGIVESLEESIKHGGSTIKNYVDSEGKKGEFIKFANVYGRTGQSCKGCKGEVQKITQAGRGTYFCPSCQH